MNRLKIAQMGLFLLTVIGMGCSDSTQKLGIRRDFTSESYIASFDRAYFGSATDGQTDLVLISGYSDQNQTPIDSPLGAKQRGALQQMVHIHVLWQQPRSLRDDNPAASNAKISWHVVTSPSDRVIYSGSCWARVEIDDDDATFDLRNATVSISRVVGSASDPLKRASLDGVIEAKRADSLVRSYIDELSGIEASESAKAAGPPQRNPVNP